MMKQKNKNRIPRRRRRAAATVEFAVCLPVVILIVFGSIEAASMLFLRQATIQASYEAAKVAILLEGDNATATDAAIAVTNGRKLNGVVVTFEPSDVSAAAPGDIIRVTTSVPGDFNSLLPFGPFRNRTVAATANMIKE